MARRVQGEARTRKASRQPPPTVMDHVDAELKKAARRYVEMKANGTPTERVHSQRGVIRGLATSYAMWYGSTPGQPKKDMIRDIEIRHVREARAAMAGDDDA